MSRNLKELTEKACMQVGVRLDDRQLSMLCRFADILVERNKVMNLTGITDDEGIAVKHFADSLSAVKYLPTERPFKLIDVGSGAGFPGLPIKIVCDNAEVTLLDSLNKRISFLNDAAEAAGVTVNAVHSRAEAAGRDKNFREKYDIAVARAVANLPMLCEFCLPFVKVGGRFIAMKADAAEELAQTEKIISKLSGEIETVDGFTLPDGSKRTIIVIKKTSQTATKFPRDAAKISKNPLK